VIGVEFRLGLSSNNQIQADANIAPYGCMSELLDVV
jgi:hypothetical protein